MQTHLAVLVASDSAKPSELTHALQGLGFQATRGPHDFVYDWPAPAEDVEEILAFGDVVHASLQGMGCLFSMETV